MTFHYYHKLFAPEGTQRYYTTLMLHALAPRQSIESLFTVLFDFYYNNLKLQYIPDDISYRVFVKNLNARWNSNIEKDDDICLRSDSVASGLRTLFLTRAGYMTVQCEAIVRKMDALLQGVGVQELNPSANYWDRLLTDWYLKKSAVVRSGWHSSRKSQIYENVATTHENIRLLYIMEGERVCLIIPRIRFEEIRDEQPVLSFYQDDVLIYSQKLSVFGDALCWTSEKCVIPLTETDMCFIGMFTPRVEISLNGEICFNSEKKLFREYLLFDMSGREKVIHQIDRGSVRIWVPEQMDISFDEQADYHQIAAPGQLFHVNLDETSSIRISGYELFADTQTKKTFRSYANKKNVPGAMVVSGGRNYEIYLEPFSYQIDMPDDANPLAYQISVDGIICPLKSVCNPESRSIHMEAHNSAMVHHEILISDFSTGFIVFAFRYCIIPSFEILFDQPVYRDDHQIVNATVYCDGAKIELSVQTGPDTDMMTVALPRGLECEISIPVVHCILMDRNLFELDSVLWHKAIDSGAIFTIRTPPGWECFATLDDIRIPESSPKCFEIGNYIRSLSGANGVQTLRLNLQNGGAVVLWKTIKIAFSEYFLDPPLAVDDGRLLWYAGNNYIGDLPAALEVILHYSGEQTVSHTADEQNAVLDEAFPYEYGSFDYTIFLEKRSVFSRSKECIYQARLIVGDINTFRFAGRQLRLKSAMCWNIYEEQYKIVPIRYDAGILREMEYLSLSVANEEPQASPEYHAELCFRNVKTGRLIAFSNHESDEYELINPTRVWVVNEHLLILHTGTDDPIYIDKRYDSLVNKKVDWFMTRDEQRSCLETPDYFEYELVKE